MDKQLNVLIVDDEKPARDKLRRLLTEHAPVAFIAEARDGVEALKLLAQDKFDVMFLDIHMPEMDGLSVAQQLPVPAPHIVFVTAYDGFALQAFDANAIDYLLKPYDEERFLRALNKLLKVQNARGLSEPAAHPLIIHDRGTVYVLALSDIHWVEAADNYVVVHTADVSPMLRQTLSVMAQRLGSAFARCHRSYLVRTDQILRFEGSGKGDGDFHLRSGATVPCSRQYRDAVLECLTLRE